MKRGLSVMLGLCLAASAFAQDAQESDKKQDKKPETVVKPDDSKVLAILKKVDAATKKVKAVSYNVAVKGTGAAESRIPKMTDKVTLAGRAADEYFLLDPKTRTAYVDIDDSVPGTAGRLLRLLGMREFVHPAPCRSLAARSLRRAQRDRHHPDRIEGGPED